jgi:hypothetical protein
VRAEAGMILRRNLPFTMASAKVGSPPEAAVHVADPNLALEYARSRAGPGNPIGLSERL